MMNAAEYLNKIKRLNDLITYYERDIEQLEEEARTIGSFDYSSVRVQKSKSGDAGFENIIVKIVDLQHQLNKEWDKLIDIREVIKNEIYSLEDTRYMNVLKLKYIDLKDNNEIADELGYSERHISRLLGEAQKEFERTILKDVV